MIRRFLSFLSFIILLYRQELVHDSKNVDDDESSRHPDKIVMRLHKKMKEVLELRKLKYPNARELLNIDMKKQLAVDKGNGSEIFGFGWKDDKFIRCYDPAHLKHSKPFNNITDTSSIEEDTADQEGIQNKEEILEQQGASRKPNKVNRKKLELYNRYKPRLPNNQQMHCMLYASMKAVEEIPIFNRTEFRVTFRSPCKPYAVTRIFYATHKKKRIPSIIDLVVSGIKYTFEFGDKTIEKEGGQTRRTVYDEYKLLSTYLPVVNRIKKRKRRNSKLRPEQFEPFPQGQGLNSQPMDQLSRNLSLELTDGVEDDDSVLLPLNPEIDFKGKEGFKKFRKLYKNFNYSWLPYKKVGGYEILRNRDNRKPYFSYGLIEPIWETKSPVRCFTRIIKPNSMPQWNKQVINNNKSNKKQSQHKLNDKNKRKRKSSRNLLLGNLLNNAKQSISKFKNNAKQSFSKFKNKAKNFVNKVRNKFKRPNSNSKSKSKSKSKSYSTSAVNTPIYLPKKSYKISCTL